MEQWLQSVAVGVAVLVGLVAPASDLRLEFLALNHPPAVVVRAEVAGAATAQVEQYLLAGNSVTLDYEFQWGEVRLIVSKTLGYRAWDAVFSVSRAGGAPFETQDQQAAVRLWTTLEETLGTREELEASLGRPLRVRVALAPDSLRALWGYRVLDKSLLFRSWLEIPR